MIKKNFVMDVRCDYCEKRDPHVIDEYDAHLFATMYCGHSTCLADPFHLSTSTCSWYAFQSKSNNYIYHKVWDELLVRSQTSTLEPLKMENGKVISSHILLDVHILIHAMIKVNPGNRTSASIGLSIINI